MYQYVVVLQAMPTAKADSGWLEMHPSMAVLAQGHDLASVASISRSGRMISPSSWGWVPSIAEMK
jgi:hypothetical protein